MELKDRLGYRRVYGGRREEEKTNRSSGSEQTLGTELDTGENSSFKSRGSSSVRKLSFGMISYMCKGQFYFKKESFC